MHNVCLSNEANIDFKMTSDTPGVIISHSLYNSLCEAKVQIEQNDIISWDNCKKIMNPYEFIHTVVPEHKTQVSKISPLSRSFYKMIEMSSIFNLCWKDGENESGSIDLNKNINCFLDDYIHNLSPVSYANPSSDPPTQKKHIEWYVHDNYYYDTAYNGKNYNNVSSSEYRNCDNGENHCYRNAFMLKNKNIFSEGKEMRNESCNESCNQTCNESCNESCNQTCNESCNQTCNESCNQENETISNEKNQKFKSFHLAEGPGGFIEAIVHVRRNKNDEYYGMTLINGDAKCPGWKKSKKFLEENQNVILEKGVDGTGNLLSRENFMHCYKKYKNKMNLVTGDGGVDFSENFNNQEHIAIKLVIAQVAYGLAMQSNNGNFILKVFDTFSNATVDILYLLSSLYKHVFIMKPQTSRYANSERYVICKGYSLDENKEKIENILQKIYENFDNLNSKLYIETIYNFKCSRSFVSKLEEINIIIGKRQVDNIIATLNLISNKSMEKLDYYKKKHIQKCIKWCETYNIPFHKNIKTTNIFLTPSLHSHLEPRLYSEPTSYKKNLHEDCC